MAAKALNVSLAVALLFPSEMGRHISGRVLAEKHAILDEALWLNKDFHFARERCPRNLQRTVKRLRAAQQVRLRSLQWFHAACLEGQSLILAGREIPAADFEHLRDKALGCKLHALGRQSIKACCKLLMAAGTCPEVEARLGGFERLGSGLDAPPIIEPASEALKRAIVAQTHSRVGEAGHFYAVKNPGLPTQCIGFVVLDTDVTAPARKAWMELTHIEMAAGYHRINLGRSLLGWVKRRGQESGFESIFVRRDKAFATLGFWTKMRFRTLDEDWLVYGPLSFVSAAGWRAHAAGATTRPSGA